MARWTAGAKWAAGPALDGQRDMPLALRLSEGLGRCATADDGGNERLKLFSKFLLCFPDDVVILPRVKVDILQIIFSDAPEDRDTTTQRKSSLKVHARTLHGHIRDDESGILNFSDDLVVNPVKVGFNIYSIWLKSRAPNCRLNS